ncbi:sigma-54-dependent Fis family transcriptional regulator [bacterium]|nr:sigma-54-dependent Fis family transcriptional regulator [bacterium]
MNILVIDDDPKIREALAGLFGDKGYAVETAGSGAEGLALLGSRLFDVLILDVLLPDNSGTDLLKTVRGRWPGLPVLMMSGETTIALAVEATRLGARNFFEKPLNPDQLLMELRNIDGQKRLEEKVAFLQEQADRHMDLIGESGSMRELKSLIRRVAATESRVLIYGENGTGKELVARAIHRLGARHGFPFVSLNCAAISRELVEAELFGHEKGAFTGATVSRPGLFEIANHGTLFLDEVGDMAPDTQAKLLRVLEESEAVRVGGRRPYSFDVRIIAATNKTLDSEMAAGRFREDLYHRLAVMPVRVPPLRERREDIPLLSRFFLSRFCEKMGKGISFDKAALALLQDHPWSGNVRELKNLIERLVILSDGPVIGPAFIMPLLSDVRGKTEAPAPESGTAGPASGLKLPAASGGESSIRQEKGFWIRSHSPGQAPENVLSVRFKDAMQAFEKKLLAEGYKRTAGNVSQLARDLGMDRAFLHRKLKAFGILKTVPEKHK